MYMRGKFLLKNGINYLKNKLAYKYIDLGPPEDPVEPIDDPLTDPALPMTDKKYLRDAKVETMTLDRKSSYGRATQSSDAEY